MTKFPYVVILDNVRSALNVGAIFRTCDGAGVEKLYLCGITPYPPHNKLPKTALGAEEYVEWERGDTKETCLKLKALGYKLYAVEQDPNSVNYAEVDYPAKSAFIFGNEISGVSEEIKALCDQILEIPMFGQKNSLNIATCAGIICYHVTNHFAKTHD
jgi:23S rRNA (guanosine2251-2'-O)-methyltransferase